MHTLLVPKEKPVLSGLNTIYIDHEKFLEHLREQYGSGCIHYTSTGRQALLFFSRSGYLPGKIFQEDKIEEFTGLDTLLDNLDEECSIDVYALSSDAGSFWSHLPAMVDEKRIYADSHRELKTTFDSFKKNHFSGYLSIIRKEGGRGGILFFGQGEFLGGSYSWGEGGLDSSVENRNQLSHQLDAGDEHVIRLGRFLYNQYYEDEEEATVEVETESDPVDAAAIFSELLREEEEAEEAVELTEVGEVDILPGEEETITLDDITGYINAFHEVLRKKNDAQLLKEKFLEHLDEYPFLDPFLRHVDYSYGLFHYHGDEDEDTVARAVIACIREIVKEQKEEKKFSRLVEKWPGHKMLLEKKVLLKK